MKKDFVHAVFEIQQALLEWDFGTANSCSLGGFVNSWNNYVDRAELALSELPIVLSINEPFLRKSNHP